MCEIPGISLVHLDHLSQMTDHTLAHRKTQIPEAEVIISEIMDEFTAWLENRKFAPTIRALKTKLTAFKDLELETQRKKLSNFNQEQADLIGDRIIHKIMAQFASHLKDENTSSSESLQLIQKMFQLENQQS